MATKTKGPGRPQKYPLTAAQRQRIEKAVEKGESTKSIAERLEIHEFAVIRVRRALRTA